MEIQRVNVLGVGVSVLDQDRAREFLFDAVRQGRRGYVTVANVHSVSEAQNDPELKRILNEALLTTPDGMPLVWMGRLQGHRSIRRVYGPDLLLNLCSHSSSAEFSHFFFGGKPGVVEELVRNLKKQFPALRIAGTYTPPFRPLSEDERQTLQELAREAKPDFFWVGIGMPRQEKFMFEYLPILAEAKIFIGIGAAFDFLAGRVRQAPRWMMRLGLEWLFRLCQEPKRLWRRYLIYNPLFILRALRQLLDARKYPLPATSGSMPAP